MQYWPMIASYQQVPEVDGKQNKLEGHPQSNWDWSLQVSTSWVLWEMPQPLPYPMFTYFKKSKLHNNGGDKNPWLLRQHIVMCFTTSLYLTQSACWVIIFHFCLSKTSEYVVPRVWFQLVWSWKLEELDASIGEKQEKVGRCVSSCRLWYC